MGLHQDENEGPPGVWDNQVADAEGQVCIWCNRKIARHAPIAVSEEGKVMHRDCFEDQPTQVSSPGDKEFD